MDGRDVGKKALSFEDAERDALVDWMKARLESEAGGGVDLGVTVAGGRVEVQGGFSGIVTWKRLGLGAALLTALDLAVSRAGGSLGMLAGLPALALFMGVGPSLSGSANAWRSARAEGKPALAAFGAVCERAALGMRLEYLPNAARASAAGKGALMLGALSASAALPPGGAAAAGMAGVAARMQASGAASIEAGERFAERQNRWRIGAALLEGSKHAAEDAYAELGKGWLRERFFLLVDPVANPGMAAFLAGGKLGEAGGQTNYAPWMPSAREIVLRAKYASLIGEQPLDGAGLLRALDLLDGSGAGPSYSPAPGMPSVARLAAAFAGWREVKLRDVDPESKERVARWSAQDEAREIMGAVGEAVPLGSDPGAPAPAKRRRL